MSRRIECRKCGTMNKAGDVCRCSEVTPLRTPLWADRLQIENMELRKMLADAVRLARCGKYAAIDFVEVGRRLDAMDNYLSNAEASEPRP